ncbi:MAG TPA: S1C family serine protease [Candidatus Acidoferrum sp.]
MSKHLLTVLLAVTSLFGPSPQAGPVNVKLRVLLVDKDLNQKPVPFYVVGFRNTAGNTAAIELKTDLDGKAEKQLPPGKYLITSAKPMELGGKRYTWNLEVQISGAEQQVDLTNDNAKVEDAAPSASSGNATASSGPGSDLSGLFDKLKNSVVAVHSESRTGSGFLADSSGLVVTNNHVVESSNYLAVQFDQARKVPARLIAADPDKDVAVLWVNLSAFPESVIAPIIPKENNAPIIVGQRVFTIGNPLGREKVLTTGVISKVEKDAITSDININPGNSGGPLFTMGGQVAGLTTSGLRNLASIVPIDSARPVLDQAKQKIASAVRPSAELLPVAPREFFPVEPLRALLQQEKMDTKPYNFELGQFHVWIFTPPLTYFLRHEDEMAAARKAAKRAGGDPSQAKPPASALEDAQDFLPVLVVSVRPRLGIGWTHPKFKNGFQKMRLLCGGKELTPIEPGRSEFNLVDQRERKLDTTYQGRYVYQPDALSPACGGAQLEVYSEKDPDTPLSKTIDATTIERIWADLEPYRKAQKQN